LIELGGMLAFARVVVVAVVDTVVVGTVVVGIDLVAEHYAALDYLGVGVVGVDAVAVPNIDGLDGTIPDVSIDSGGVAVVAAACNYFDSSMAKS